MKSLYRTAIENVTRLLPLVIRDVEDVNSEVLIVNLVIEIVLRVCIVRSLSLSTFQSSYINKNPTIFLLFIGILFLCKNGWRLGLAKRFWQRQYAKLIWKRVCECDSLAKLLLGIIYFLFINVYLNMRFQFHMAITYVIKFM